MADQETVGQIRALLIDFLGADPSRRARADILLRDLSTANDPRNFTALTCLALCTTDPPAPPGPISNLAAVLLRHHLPKHFSAHNEGLLPFLHAVLQALPNVGHSPTGSALMHLLKTCVTMQHIRHIAWPPVVQFAATQDLPLLAALVAEFTAHPMDIPLAVSIANDLSPLLLPLLQRPHNGNSGNSISGNSISGNSISGNSISGNSISGNSGGNSGGISGGNGGGISGGNGGGISDGISGGVSGNVRRILRSIAGVFTLLGHGNAVVAGGIAETWRELGDRILLEEHRWEVHEAAAHLLFALRHVRGWNHTRSFTSLSHALQRTEVTAEGGVDPDTGDLCSPETLCSCGLLAIAAMPARVLRPPRDVLRLAAGASFLPPRMAQLFAEQPNEYVAELEDVWAEVLRARHAAVDVVDKVVEEIGVEVAARLLRDLAGQVGNAQQAEAVLWLVVKVVVDTAEDTAQDSLQEVAAELAGKILNAGEIYACSALWAVTKIPWRNDTLRHEAVKLAVEALSCGKVNAAVVVYASRVVALAAMNGFPHVRNPRELVGMMVSLLDQTNADTVHILLESIRGMIQLANEESRLSSSSRIDLYICVALVGKLEGIWERCGNDPFVRDEVVEIFCALIDIFPEETLQRLQRYLETSLGAISLYQLVQQHSNHASLDTFSNRFAEQLCGILTQLRKENIEPDIIEQLVEVFIDHTGRLRDLKNVLTSALSLLDIIPVKDMALRAELVQHLAETCVHRGESEKLRVFIAECVQRGLLQEEALAKALKRPILLLRSSSFLEDDLKVVLLQSMLQSSGM